MPQPNSGQSAFAVGHSVCISFQALHYLGVTPSAEEKEELRRRLHIDRDGTTTYGGEIQETLLYVCSWILILRHIVRIQSNL